MVNKGLSVIIPTFNRERFIGIAIKSVLSQNYPYDIEIIVSDDGSTDQTISIAQSFGSIVKILIKPKDCKTQGAAGARNRGIRASNKSFVCFLDSDDFFLPGHLKKMISLFEREPSLHFGFCRTLEIKEDKEKLFYRHWTRGRIFTNDIKNPVISRSRVVNTNSLMFRREVFDKSGTFNESYQNGEDGDMWIRISELFKGGFSDHYGVAYNNHSSTRLVNNPSNTITSSSFKIFEEAKKRYYILNLKDSNRIFKIEYILLWLRYNNTFLNKLRFFSKYLLLIFRYPSGYFQKIIEDFYSIPDRWEKWKPFNNTQPIKPNEQTL